AIKKAVHCLNGHWSFSDSAQWMTTLGEIPYDAKMLLKGKNWEVDFPDSSELLIVPDSAGIRAIARVLMCNNIPCPCALAADGSLLTEFLSRPRHCSASVRNGENVLPFKIRRTYEKRAQ